MVCRKKWKGKDERKYYTWLDNTEKDRHWWRWNEVKCPHEVKSRNPSIKVIGDPRKFQTGRVKCSLLDIGGKTWSLTR